jgi:type I restriction-modification system DNA methylase subunit
VSRLEKVTDMLVFNLLRANNYVDGAFKNLNPNVYVWAKKSTNKIIDTVLSKASKQSTGKQGYPEFIIYDSVKQIVIVIEDKKDTSKHMYSEIHEKVDEYAVNGALWYASKLKEEFDVIAIGISGNSIENLKIDTYAWKKKAVSFSNLNIHKVLRIEEYRNLLQPETSKTKKSLNEHLKIISEANEINNFLRDYLGVIEHERLYVLGSILFALDEPRFKMWYSTFNSDEELAHEIWKVVERKIEASQLKSKDIIVNELKSTLLSLKDAQKEEVKEIYPNGVLLELTKKVDNIIFDYHKNSELDVISLFFNVFLSYSTSGGSDLGIVLTPSHITKLFCDLANINLNSKILDICAGTGGFLTAAWKVISQSPKYTKQEKEAFRNNNLFGVEKDKSIYTIIALNMFLNKDGRSNLYKGDCFSLKDELLDFKCNVGFINPPYSDSVYSEIRFVELMLDVLLPNSIGIAILPVNSVSSRTKKHSGLNDIKKRILEKHSLIASIQMPTNLFYPKGTETIVLVFETGKPNSEETWFAKYDDGYTLIKHQKARTPGRDSELKHRKFIEAYRNKSVTAFSFNKYVSYDEQWVYTVYADYEYEVEEKDLQNTVNEYISYLFKHHYF